jgi:F-type H+-transporting ATPase subunit gamma
MSDSAASLRHTIASATDLQAVVRTMKALAASSLGQYEQSVLALADYDRTVEQGLSACLHANAVGSELSATEVRRLHPATMAIVFGSDQGLVGQFNETMTDFAQTRLSGANGPLTVWAVGERVFVRMVDAGIQVRGPLGVPQSVKGITALVAQLLLMIEAAQSSHALGELLIFHNRPATGSVYAPVVQRLLPLDAAWRRRLMDIEWPTKNLPEVIGGGVTLLRMLVAEHLFVSLFRACAESQASENASRLAAMERADRNISELLDDLQGRFNRLRQSSIDAELFDVISGFEALAPTGGNASGNRSSGAR